MEDVLDSREMSFIRKGLYLGSQAAEMQPLEELKRKGIRSVLQLGTGCFMQPSHPALTYKCISANDVEGVDLVKILIKDDFLRFIDEGIERGGVLVHCQAGISRSVTAVTAYLMIREHRELEDALVEVMKCRKYAAPNIGFCCQLKGLEAAKGDTKKYKGEVPFLQDFFSRMAWLDKLRRICESSG